MNTDLNLVVANDYLNAASKVSNPTVSVHNVLCLFLFIFNSYNYLSLYICTYR